MCFVTTVNSRARTAKEDITCWKILTPHNRSWMYQDFKGYEYKKGVVNPKIRICKITLTVKHDVEFIINEGYHSYRDNKSGRRLSCFITNWVQNHRRRPNDNDKTGKVRRVKRVKFIIPKGTRYYQNDKEYVSETIIML